MTLNAVAMPKNTPRHLAQYRDDWHHLAEYQEGYMSGFDAHHDLRRTAWEEFERIGFPVHRRGNELWKYTDLRQIDRIDFRFGDWDTQVDLARVAELVPMPEEWSNLVFVNGSLEHNSDDAPLTRIQACDWVGELADYRSNGFVALATAFLRIRGGAYLHFDRPREYVRPVHIIHVIDGSVGGPIVDNPRVAVEMDDGSRATLIESYVSLSDDTHMTLPVVEIKLSEGAKLTHYRYQNNSENSFHFATTRVLQEASSDYRSTSFSVGSDIGRNDVFTHLVGEYAESTLHGVYLTTNRQHQDNEISTTHTAPHCTSDQYYKGILSGRSRAVFSGKITVERGAQKTDANQKDLNLLLSHGAEVDTKPSLEIYADDVKCAHGATAGHVDEDTLFYLQSRGVDYDTAQAMLIRGFAAEILSEFEDDELHAFLENQLDALMPELQATSDTIGTA